MRTYDRRPVHVAVDMVASPMAASRRVAASLERIFQLYLVSPAGSPFGRADPLWSAFEEFGQAVSELEPVAKRLTTVQVKQGGGLGRKAKIPWLALLDRRETSSTQRGVYCVFLFRQDMSGVYLTLAQGVTAPRTARGSEARRYLQETAVALKNELSGMLRQRFELDGQVDLRAHGRFADDYAASVVAFKLYESDALPDDAEVAQDLDTILQAYGAYVERSTLAASRRTARERPESVPKAAAPARPVARSESFNHQAAVERLVRGVERVGFVFEPWQIAAYVAALRTKPFGILAGITGTGKSKLPALVARLTGGRDELIPVRPDWTDSADVLGYRDLQGGFRPGPLLVVAREAQEHAEHHVVCILDEMNLARVEQYLAEVLSKIEDRRPSADGGFRTEPLLWPAFADVPPWSSVGISANLAIVGTVNMDESTHGFSRKVLDRAFTIELSDIDLGSWATVKQSGEQPDTDPWPAAAWYPRSISLSGLRDVTDEERADIQRVVDVLVEVNRFLAPAQLQVGYRTRDEVALFAVHSRAIRSAFVTRTGSPVDPLDLALQMKVLPRIVGGSAGVRRALLQLLGWAHSGTPAIGEDDAQTVLDAWEKSGRSGELPNARFPRTAARLSLMWERLLAEGFTSFWL